MNADPGTADRWPFETVGRSGASLDLRFGWAGSESDQALLDELPGKLWVGFAAGESHDLAAEEAGGGLGLLRVHEGVLDGALILGEGLTDPRLRGRGVRYLKKPELLGKFQRGGQQALDIEADWRLCAFWNDWIRAG